jgi:hypothetical protein
MNHKKILTAFIILGVCLLLGYLYLTWHSTSDGQSTLRAYPITLSPDGSGTSSIMEYVDRTLIENVTHLTDNDLSQYPAIAEVLTGEHKTGRGFLSMGGMTTSERQMFPKKYFVSEYDGNYYIFLVEVH